MSEASLDFCQFAKFYCSDCILKLVFVCILDLRPISLPIFVEVLCLLLLFVQVVFFGTLYPLLHLVVCPWH